MMFKEKGYDEFLAEKIRLGKEDIAAGRVVTLEEAKKQWQQTIERKASNRDPLSPFIPSSIESPLH